MADIVSPETRSRMMSGIKGKDTRPELLIRKGLHAKGHRYRLHVKSLSGKPDLVFPKYRAVILVHGCFWHGHNCHLFKWPSTRKDFWRQKITGNQKNDSKNLAALKEDNWRVMTIWECALKGRERIPLNEIIDKAAEWLLSNRLAMEIRGRKKRDRE